MVAFETLLLGLVIGHVRIRLMVTAPAASVELRLDGAIVGTLRAPPWELDCDLGRDPLPHELSAVGRDASGRVAARATQWVNLGDDRLKLSTILERDPTSARPVAVRVTWDTLEQVRPRVDAATLDGAPLPLTDPRRIPLPRVDLAQPHIVSVEASASPTVHDRADLAFGGDVVDSADSELTAVAVSLPPKQDTLSVHEVQDLFSAGGSGLNPIAVDTGRAEVALVVDQSVRELLTTRRKDWVARFGDVLPYPIPLDPTSDRFSVAETVPRLLRDANGNLITFYPMTPPYALGWLWRRAVLWSLSLPIASPDQQRIADAVAVVAQKLAASSHRRTLVLVLAEPPARAGVAPRINDASTYDVAGVKAYLAALGVPLRVWSLTGTDPGPLTAAWGSAEYVPDRWAMQSRAKKLKKELDAQRIVWFAGRHLPQRIALDESKTAMRLAR